MIAIVIVSLVGVLALSHWLEGKKKVCECGWPARKHENGRCER